MSERIIKYNILFIHQVLNNNNFSEENKEILKEIFVNKQSQSDMARKYNKTSAAISQLCKRFNKCYLIEIGYVEVNLLVPKNIASIIKKLYKVKLN